MKKSVKFRRWISSHLDDWAEYWNQAYDKQPCHEVTEEWNLNLYRQWEKEQKELFEQRKP